MAGILLLGTDKDRASGIRSMLREDGHEVTWHRRLENWPQREHEVAPELVVATVDDLNQVLAVPGRRQKGFPAPILFVNEDGGISRDPFVLERLVDRISSPFSHEDLLARVDALARVRRIVHRCDTVDASGSCSDSSATERKYSGIRGRLRALLGARIPRREKPLGPYLEVAARLAQWNDQRDGFQPGHQERVTSLCAMIAEALGLGDGDTAALLRGAMLHDVGKVALPVEVLRQKTPLQDSQMRLIRTHPRRGAELLVALDQEQAVVDTILYHHERPNGDGYYGKGRDATPMTARVLAVAEVYDAMTTSRLMATLTQESALKRMNSLKGEMFDTDCVEALIDTLKPRTNTIALAEMA